MSNGSKVQSSPTSMIDVDLSREWDGATIGVTVYEYDFTDVDNLIHQGYRIVQTVTIL